MASRRRKKRKAALAAARVTGSQAGASEVARARRAMWVIVVCYLFLAGSYAVGIPLGRGPDESAHVRYVEFLAEHHQLPVFDRANPDPDYEFHQPPLYYALCLPTYLPAARDSETAQHTVRFFSLLLSVALIYLTFALGRSLAPDHPWVAAGAAGLVAFLPMHLSVSTTVANDVLTEAFAAATLLVLILHLRGAGLHAAGKAERPPGPGAMAAAGALIGLGMLTKSIVVLLFPVAWVAAALAARSDTGYRWRQLGRDIALTTGVALALSGWWLVRNQVLYGDPLAQSAFLDAFQGRRPSPEDFMQRYQVPSVASYVGQVMIWTAASVTGVFGPVRGNQFAFFPFWVYFTTGALGIAGVLGFARYLSAARLTAWQRHAWWVCGLFGALLLASFVRFNFSFFQAQARYLFPILPAAAVAFCLGLQELFSEQWRQRVLLAAIAALALLALAGLHVWIAPQFGPA